MKKKLLISIYKGDSDAMDNGDSNAMLNLGMYYHKIEKKYEEAKKYYLMAMDNGVLDVIELLNEVNAKLG
jgi:TPR repeat protein